MYRISTAKEWEELQKNGSVFGGELDRSSGFIHLSKLDQVLLLKSLIRVSICEIKRVALFCSCNSCQLLMPIGLFDKLRLLNVVADPGINY